MDSLRVWQDVALQQAELTAQRLRELLRQGLGLLRSEVGLELRFEPERFPTWALLLVPSLLLAVLLWAVSCGGRKKSQPGEAEAQSSLNKTHAGLRSASTTKNEETKKKNKKKGPEKSKSSEQNIPELSEEELIEPIQTETLKQTRDVEKKIEKSKKKKKSKSDLKQGHFTSSLDGKEFEEGTWETKKSNKEKRQHRKRVKGSGESESAGVESSNVANEQLANLLTFPVGLRKTKVASELNAMPTVNGGSSWNEKSIKISQLSGGEEKWLSMSSVTTGKRKTEPSSWITESGDTNGKEWSAPWSERPFFQSIPAWSAVDGRINHSEQASPSFPTLALNPVATASTSEKVSQPSVADVQWDLNRNPSQIEDEWCGPNGLNCTETSSDWKAPAEEWGNFIEEETLPTALTEEPSSDNPKISDDEKEKGDSNVQSSTSGKTKKKKKKKKKQGEESGPLAQDTDDLEREVVDDLQEESSAIRLPETDDRPCKTLPTSEPNKHDDSHPVTVFIEPSVTVCQTISEKISAAHLPQKEADVSISNKQNTVPPPLQTKSEESWESPKQVKKKKKARRET